MEHIYEYLIGGKKIGQNDKDVTPTFAELGKGDVFYYFCTQIFLGQKRNWLYKFTVDSTEYDKSKETLKIYHWYKGEVQDQAVKEIKNLNVKYHYHITNDCKFCFGTDEKIFLEKVNEKFHRNYKSTDIEDQTI